MSLSSNPFNRTHPVSWQGFVAGAIVAIVCVWLAIGFGYYFLETLVVGWLASIEEVTQGRRGGVVSLSFLFLTAFLVIYTERRVSAKYPYNKENKLEANVAGWIAVLALLVAVLFPLLIFSKLGLIN